MSMTERDLETISEISARIGAEKALEAFVGQEEKSKDEYVKRKIKRTKNMLDAYHKVKRQVKDDDGFTKEEQAAMYFQFLKDLMESPEKNETNTERIINDEYRHRQENVYVLESIDRALECYRKDAEELGTAEDQRRVRVIECAFIDSRMSKTEIAEKENVSEKTVDRDMNSALKEMAFRLHLISISDL